MLSERMNWSLQNNKDGNVSQLSSLGKQLGHMYSKDMFIPLDQTIFLEIHPTELSLKCQKALYTVTHSFKHCNCKILQTT